MQGEYIKYGDVQAARGGYLDAVKELLDHGADVPMSLLLSPLIQQPVKDLLERHLIVYVWHLSILSGVTVIYL